MREEFAVYGLPSWFMVLAGSLKLLFATLLIVGLGNPALAQVGALGLAVLMLGAVAMHFKVNDPAIKALPAFTMLALSLFIVAA